MEGDVMAGDLEREYKEIKKRWDIYRAIQKVKLYWPGDHLTDEEKKAICKVSDEYFGEDQRLGVLFACTKYRTSKKPRSGKHLGPGRPKNSKDYAVKRLINHLASIYKRHGPTKLPKTDDSRFGEMVEKIAKALNVKNAKGFTVTWAGHVNDVLNEPIYNRFREKPSLQYMYADFGVAIEYFEAKSMETSALSSADLREILLLAIRDVQRKLEFEEKIKELPESEKYIISVEKKLSNSST